MPVKRRSKGNKLARMSDEERARYLQHRAEIELEAKRRKQQLIATFTKNKLKREEAFSRLNTAKINEQWRFILRQIKCKEFYQEVEYLWKNFERLMKIKNEIIMSLYGELETADLDHRKLQDSHIEIMDVLIGRHKQQLKSLHCLYAQELESLQNKDIIELEHLKSNMVQNSNQIRGVIFKQEAELGNKMTATRIQNSVKIQNITYLNEDVTANLICHASMEFHTLWEQLNNVITNYERTSRAKKKQYEYLKQQDDAHLADVAQYPKLLLQLQTSIENLKRGIKTLSRQRSTHIALLKNKNKQTKLCIESIRHDFTETQIADSSQLKKLSVTSSNVLKDLQKTSNKGFTIVEFIKTCSNLEPSILILKKNSFGDVEVPASYTTQPFFKMDNFWKQYNHIKADNISLKEKSKELSLENKQLKQMLRTYLISVSGVPAPRPFTSISI